MRVDRAAACRLAGGLLTMRVLDRASQATRFRPPISEPMCQLNTLNFSPWIKPYMHLLQRNDDQRNYVINDHVNE